MNVISVKNQKILVGHYTTAVAIPKGLIIEVINEGIIPFKNFIQLGMFIPTKKPAHYLFNGRKFSKLFQDKEQVKKKEMIKKDVKIGLKCKFGCGNLALYPAINPTRCSAQEEQCPSYKHLKDPKQVSDLQKVQEEAEKLKEELIKKMPVDTKLCERGCGQIAIHPPKNPKYCAKSPMTCPIVKAKAAEKRAKNKKEK